MGFVLGLLVMQLVVRTFLNFHSFQQECQRAALHGDRYLFVTIGIGLWAASG
jgi:hypothetical protein